MAAGLVVCCGLGLAAAARAVDGVREINQAKALAGGVSAGDLPGFPVTIDEPGSYRLTGSLAISGGGTVFIELLADHVTIDLNGFELAGDNVCTGSPVTSCTQQNAGGHGITGDARRNVEVRNGIIRNVGGDGIRLSNSSGTQVRDLRVSEAGGRGISVSEGALVERCAVRRNFNDGILGANRVSVVGNVILGNGGRGIAVTSDSRIADNVIERNNGDGIRSNLNSLVVGNMVTDNNGAGLASPVAVNYYAGNVFTDNDATLTGAAVAIGTNACNGTATCP